MTLTTQEKTILRMLIESELKLLEEEEKDVERFMTVSPFLLQHKTNDLEVIATVEQYKHVLREIQGKLV